MRPLLDRAELIRAYCIELARFGVPEVSGRLDGEILVLLDGVGGLQAAPLMVRRALRKEGAAIGTVLYKWQFGLPGEIWIDLMWLRRNRVMGCHLARRILALRRKFPNTRLHIMAYSGGAGIAVFACEQLARRVARARRAGPDESDSHQMIESLILACPALSSKYNFAPALRVVQRAYALVSHRDALILGLGTRLFGTTDRRYESAGGRVGFQVPANLPTEDGAIYDRFREIRWSRDWRSDGHSGGHVGPASVAFLRRHLLPLLRGEPLLPAHRLPRT